MREFLSKVPFHALNLCQQSKVYNRTAESKRRASGILTALGAYSFLPLLGALLIVQFVKANDFDSLFHNYYFGSFASSNYISCAFPLFLMSADFPRTKKKSYHTAEGAICYIKQILICIIVAPISVLAQQQNQQSSIQKDIVCKAFCLTGEPSVGSIAISSIQGQGTLAS